MGKAKRAHRLPEYSPVPAWWARHCVSLPTLQVYIDPPLLINAIIEDGTIPLIDLNALDIKSYDYEYSNHTDNFMSLIERIIRIIKGTRNFEIVLN